MPADSFVLPCKIDTYGNAWNGTLAYGLFEYNSTNLSQRVDSYLVVMKTNGDLACLREGADCGWAVARASACGSSQGIANKSDRQFLIGLDSLLAWQARM